MDNFELIYKFNMIFAGCLNDSHILDRHLVNLKDLFGSSCIASNETRTIDLNKIKNKKDELKENAFKNYKTMEDIYKKSSELKLTEEKEFFQNFNDFNKYLKNSLSKYQKQLMSLDNTEQNRIQKMNIIDYFYIYSDLIPNLNKNNTQQKDLILEYNEIMNKFSI